jgi:hypothetical protein
MTMVVVRIYALSYYGKTLVRRFQQAKTFATRAEAEQFCVSINSLGRFGVVQS